MARLIIGHVSDQQARIWVRGTAEHPAAFLTVVDAGGSTVFDHNLNLEARHFFTGVFEVDGLNASTEYTCEVLFGRHADTELLARRSFPDNRGRFRTPPAPGASGASPSFLLGSCNLHSLGVVSRPGPAYRRLTTLAEVKNADFMIHCGDQIYADVPAAALPHIDHYRRKYLDAWDDSESTRAFLTRLPHYMILDDHEIRNNFHNDLCPSDACLEVLQIGSLKAYREFQHIHNPQTFGSGPLYYTFAHGDAHFFVLDTRTERFREKPDNQMIDEIQMERFQAWLVAHAADLKFVVTSVPFVGEIRNDDDKWNAPSYRDQKHEILNFLIDQGIGRVVFLTGDMHNSYHATLRASDGNGGQVEVHELMSSPINQITKSALGRYRMNKSHSFTRPRRLDYRASFGSADNGQTAFYTGHSNAMAISVGDDGNGATQVRYEVVRTKKNRAPELTGRFAV